MTKRTKRMRLSPDEAALIEKNRSENQRRIMILPDLHAPFIIGGAFEFAATLADKYNITEFACTGDTVDFHKSSFHTSETDSLNADDELDNAIKVLNRWHNRFKGVLVSTGNHERIPERKLKEAGLSTKFTPSLSEVLNVPTWDFKPYHNLGHNTKLIHGIGRTAFGMAMDEGQNIIMGHKHSQTFIRQMFLKRYGQLFAMQLGSFIDENSYAARYSVGGASSVPSIGFLFENDDHWIPFFKIMNI